MRAYLFVSVCLGLVLCTYASSSTPCFARITASPRPGASWTTGLTQYQLYDITVTNEGTCALTRVVGYFSAGPGSITEAWNYNVPSGLISGYGASLQVGQTFTGAGFVVANSSFVTLAFDRPGCDTSCGATSAPVTTPSPVTTNPPTTPAPSTSAPSGCAVDAVVTREGNMWMDAQGRNTSVYRLTLTNNGPCALTTYVLSFGIYPGDLISTFNLVSSRGGYLVSGFGSSLAPGASYSGAGLIIANAPSVVGAFGYGSVCGQCP